MGILRRLFRCPSCHPDERLVIGQPPNQATRGPPQDRCDVLGGGGFVTSSLCHVSLEQAQPILPVTLHWRRAYRSTEHGPNSLTPSRCMPHRDCSHEPPPAPGTAGVPCVLAWDSQGRFRYRLRLGQSALAAGRSTAVKLDSTGSPGGLLFARPSLDLTGQARRLSC